MKKILSILLFLTIILFSKTSYASNTEVLENQSNELNIDKFISDTEQIVNQDIDFGEVFNESIKGKSSSNLIFKTIGTVLGKELRQALNMVTSILIIILLHGILKSISENLGNEQTGKIGYFIQLILLITVLVKVYTQIIEVVKATLGSISNFIYTLIPFFMSVIVSTGNITAATSIQTIILVATNIITSFINNIVIPIIIIATAIGIISNISDDIKMDKISKYMKSCIIWLLCISLTIFTCILSVESSLGQGVDQMTTKTTKTAISTFVPVVGKILGDAVESVLGCTNLIKNAIGAVGVIALIIIGILPLIRIGITMMFFYLAGGLAELVADKKIVCVLEQMGDSCKVLFAALASVTVMLIIGITISMKISMPI